MLRRCQFLLVSLAVCVASVLPSFAWSEESFVGRDKLDDLGVDVSSSVVDSPSVMMAASSYAISDPGSVSSRTLPIVDLTPVLPQSFTAGVSFDLRVDLPTGGSMSTSGAKFYPDDVGLSGSPNFVSGNWLLYPVLTFTYEAPDNSSNPYLNLLFPGRIPATSFDLNYDVSSLDASILEFDGAVDSGILVSGPSSRTRYLTGIEILVDGVLVKSFSVDSPSRSISLDGYIYSGSSPVSTVTFRLYHDQTGLSVVDGSTYSSRVYLYGSTTASITGLIGSSAGIPSGMQGADNTLGDYENAEDQYFDNAESAVGGLNTSVPDGMLGSAAMIGGMFNDLWTVLGDFSLIYFIPLLFSFFLWIIGRKRGGSG